MSLYNEDELIPPAWINKEFFEKVLQQYENNESIKLIKLDLTPASMKGDHYASVMFRCKISYICDSSSDPQQKSFILKTLPLEDCAKRDMLKESNLFETEISMYNEVLPKIEKILAECGEPTKLSAGLIYHALEPHKVIIFEDLCESGYKIFRERDLNENEVKLIYNKIAKLHAVSYMLAHSENSECVTKFKEGIFSTSTILAMDVMIQGIFSFINMLEKHEKEFHQYLDKFKTLQPDIKESCKNLYNAYKLNRSDGEIFVLNHGDFHMKNLMFKLNSNQQIEDVIMVDYQISCYAPSNVDMVYSQYMILSPDLRLRRNELMHYYFEEFTRILKRINFQGKMPHYSDFQITGLKYKHYSIFLLTTLLPLAIAVWNLPPEKLRHIDANKYLESSELAATTYEHPKYIDELRNLLPSLLVEGYLD
ncbi:uncharacterized protein ACRADG_012730 [Cochliomyia hominivorax]